MFISASQTQRRPIALKWRSSSWTITFVIGLGIAVDLLVYSTIIPVMPFHLEQLGYSNVAALTGWLLFAYASSFPKSALTLFFTVLTATIPIAMFSERYRAKKFPLIFGLLVLVASQVMLMEAPTYVVMCVARILQGFGSSMVWVVGLALLCDSSPTSLIGLQLGLAMCGLSVGIAIGPPVGGLLFGRYGYRGPFIFGITATVLDLFGRVILIERKDALVWGIDPTILSAGRDRITSNFAAVGYDPQDFVTAEPSTNNSEKPRTTGIDKNLSLLSVIVKLSKSSRALVALFLVFVYGYFSFSHSFHLANVISSVVYTSQEPTIALYLQHVWNLDSRAVGLVFLAGVVPTLLSSPLAGYLSGKNGAEWVTVLSLALALPWWAIIIIQYRLPLFVTAFAVQSFFTSGVISPLTAELATVSRGLEGVGYAHVYGAFNLVYGIGNSGDCSLSWYKIYDHIGRGWMALCLLAIGSVALSLILAICFVGADPLLHRLRRRFHRDRLE
ncbi:hypothetical protein GALMADRAFT_52881 [Galerina marginata CBS 339.88]|uniref:Major facilitator superfamily (MFS) profile domain-containing protein n=1 Tax=Galerina marginata (strain CBS 339.88) TaxID=685588 RepID=A0A067TZ16_GALM3|nr:hypothetical protein GALMADRAFT_52881 [Galerina marginata CBS 339.88]